MSNHSSPKSISLLCLFALCVVFVNQVSRADEFDERAQAQAAAEAQREDQQQYANEVARINGKNKNMVSRIHSLASANGGSARNIRC